MTSLLVWLLLLTSQELSRATIDLRQVTLADQNVTPVAVTRILPEYPSDARAAGVQGVVEIEIVVGADGGLIQTRIAQPTAKMLPLEKAALDAVGRWTFRPAIRYGAPVPALTVIRMQFTLPGSGSGTPVTAEIVPPARVPAPLPDPNTLPIRTFVGGAAGLQVPTPIRIVNPGYTSEAMRAKITGTVTIAAVVLPDGTVGSARIVRSLDRTFGLDQEALVAARYWLFKPGMVNGQPVPCVVTLVLEFRLH